MNRPAPLQTSNNLNRSELESQGTADTLSPPTQTAVPAGELSALTDDVVVVLLIDLAPGSLLWGWSRVVFGKRL